MFWGKASSKYINCLDNISNRYALGDMQQSVKEASCFFAFCDKDRQRKAIYSNEKNPQQIISESKIKIYFCFSQ